MPPRIVRPGESILAEDNNALVRLSKRSIRGGPGIRVDQTSDATIIGLLALFPEYVFAARITRVYGMAGSLIQDVRYDAQPFKESDGSKVVYKLPRYGRLVGSGIAVTPATVGTLCAIVRVPINEPPGFTADIFILPGTEQPVLFRCTSTGTPGPPIPIIGPNGQPITPPVVPPDGGPFGPPDGTPSVTPTPGAGGEQ